MLFWVAQFFASCMGSLIIIEMIPESGGGKMGTPELCDNGGTGVFRAVMMEGVLTCVLCLLAYFFLVRPTNGFVRELGPLLMGFGMMLLTATGLSTTNAAMNPFKVRVCSAYRARVERVWSACGARVECVWSVCCVRVELVHRRERPGRKDGTAGEWEWGNGRRGGAGAVWCVGCRDARTGSIGM